MSQIELFIKKRAEGISDFENLKEDLDLIDETSLGIYFEEITIDYKRSPLNTQEQVNTGLPMLFQRVLTETPLVNIVVDHLIGELVINSVKKVFSVLGKFISKNNKQLGGDLGVMVSFKKRTEEGRVQVIKFLLDNIPEDRVNEMVFKAIDKMENLREYIGEEEVKKISSIVFQYDANNLEWRVLIAENWNNENQ